MGALREQMQADMVLRGMALRTQQSYIESVVKFAKFYGRSPEQITKEEVERYLLHLLQERKLLAGLQTRVILGMWRELVVKAR